MNGKVGPFFYKDKILLADSIDINDAEKYGDYKTWGNHSIFWDNLSKIHPELRHIEYFYCPRGRVTYNHNQDKYYIYLNPKLNTKSIINMILHKFDLIGLDYIIDDTDEHYQL